MIKLKLSFFCIIGCLKIERNKKQKVKIKLKIDSSEFIDYGKLANIIYKKMKKKKFIYIEDAIIYFQDYLKQCFPSIKMLKLKISKPEIFKLCKTKYKACAYISICKIY